MIEVASLSFMLAATCAALMGFSMQRGATCMVAAVGEVVTDGKTRRSRALAETSLWVAGGLILAQVAGFLPDLPNGFALSGWTIVGGILLGLGAHINRACVFGSVAQIGSGNLAYLTSPLGFFVGAATSAALFPAMRPEPVHTVAPDPAIAAGLAALFVAFVLWRGFSIIRNPDGHGWHWRTAWRPHEATIVIGIAFVVLLVVAGAWAYTDLFIQLARGAAPAALVQSLLLFALLAGASTGGRIAGIFSWRVPAIGLMIRCFIGGAVMGWGSLLVPGSNDGLILIGLPLFWPYAWVAVAVMCLTIWTAMMVERKLSRA